jgi:D-alanyl-D-alanine carboxypeptidase
VDRKPGNPSGLPDEEQVSTARDMAILARALIRTFPKYYPYFSRPSFTYHGIEHPNHNRLMSTYAGMDGLKTGYIRASGFNLAASAVRDGRRLIGVVFGGDTPAWRDAHLAELLDQGFATPRSPAPLVASAKSAKPERKPDEEVVDSTELATFAAAVTPSLKLTSTAAAAELPDSVGGGWGVQIGAFSDAAAGRRAIRAVKGRLPTLLADASPAMVAVQTASGPLYRARLMGLDEAAARTVCASLERAGEGCLMVSPAQGL